MSIISTAHTSGQDLLAADAGSAQSTAKNNLLMQLRKCCAHPSLLSASPGIEHGQAISDYVAASGKLALLDQMVCVLAICPVSTQTCTQAVAGAPNLNDWHIRDNTGMHLVRLRSACCGGAATES